MVENTDTPKKSVTPELMSCLFSVGSQEFSIDLDYLKEITELSEIVPLPLSPSYIEGVTHLRGAAVPVVKFATLKGIPEEMATERWLIVLEVNRELLGITVNEMPDLGINYRGELINVPEFFETYRIR
ncbi:chemotaxis protein CheW [bacterium BMS3Abin07]|nr:chemotaxis protein CheW [bacterium BMS3Abin07]GBE32294.1 chemotaxis protein CheW [bacterium BMS3Bbin05]HDO22932.1 hypothetical protein [Nitrospirota bacterium]HDZ87614.1 hypothetical protein [Nitrospirota bacterium]